MKQNIKTFSESFVKLLGIFVSIQKTAGKELGLNEKEIKAVMAETFNLLGKHHEEFKEKAKIK